LQETERYGAIKFFIDPPRLDSVKMTISHPKKLGTIKTRDLKFFFKKI